MKKTISSYESLLISLASKGDSTAFHSLVIPYIGKEYVQLIQSGLDHNTACGKLLETGADLFRAFIGVHTDSFEDWYLENSKNPIKVENEFLQSGKSNADSTCFSHELLLHLQRVSSGMNGKQKKQSVMKFRLKPNKIFTGIGIVASLFLFMIVVLLCLQYTLKIDLIGKSGNISFSIPAEKPEMKVVDQKSDSLQIARSIDSVKADSIRKDTIAKPKEPQQPVKRAYSSSASSVQRSSVTGDAQPASRSQNSYSGYSAPRSHDQNPAVSGSTTPATPTVQSPSPSVPVSTSRAPASASTGAPNTGTTNSATSSTSSSSNSTDTVIWQNQ